MGHDSSTAEIDHPLWARFLRWATIHPEVAEGSGNEHLTDKPSDTSSRLLNLPDYEYAPLKDPERDARVVELLPGKFEDDVRIRIHHMTLMPYPGHDRVTWREELEQVRRELPEGWEVFKTVVDRRYFFRNKKTGLIQWEHPTHDFHPQRTGPYELPPKDGAFPAYETLSYVWGDSTKTAVVEVDRPDEEGGNARLAVTESLITALRYLRYGQRKRNLWIDALCLNQSDTKELGQQVPRMGEIYRLAYTGTAWLGVESKDSTHALDTLKYLGKQVVGEGEAGLLFRSPDAKEEEWYDSEYNLPYSEGVWDAVTSLLSRPWFNRLWVVQEIHPGSHLQCGHDTISFTDFSEGQYALYNKSVLPPTLLKQMLQVDSTLSNFWTMALPRILYRATFKQCTDPRDKIYGLLGLAPPKFAESVDVSYEKDMTATDVYKMTVLSHAKITERFENFHNCYMVEEGKRKIPQGPSWVPDWATGVPHEAYIASQFVTTNSRAHWKYSEDEGGVLKLLGKGFGKVDHATKPLSLQSDRWEAIQHIRSWEPEDLDNEIYKPTGDTLRRAYALTLICNGLREREPDWLVSPVEIWESQDWNEALFASHVTKSDVSQTTTLRQDTLDALQVCAGRSFFRTEDGHIGLGPAGMREGDIVAIFLGAPNAVILRPVSVGDNSSTSQHSLVGECYVYGLDNAVPLLGPLPKPWSAVAAWLYGDRRVVRFVNSETSEKTVEDPRLGAIDGWERIDKPLDRDDPTLYDFWQNKDTKDIINYDPRLEPAELEKRGMKLEWFDLV